MPDGSARQNRGPKREKPKLQSREDLKSDSQRVKIPGGRKRQNRKPMKRDTQKIFVRNESTNSKSSNEKLSRISNKRLPLPQRSQNLTVWGTPRVATSFQTQNDIRENKSTSRKAPYNRIHTEESKHGKERVAVKVNKAQKNRKNAAGAKSAPKPTEAFSLLDFVPLLNGRPKKNDDGKRKKKKKKKNTDSDKHVNEMKARVNGKGSWANRIRTAEGSESSAGRISKKKDGYMKDGKNAGKASRSPEKKTRRKEGKDGEKQEKSKRPKPTRMKKLITKVRTENVIREILNEILLRVVGKPKKKKRIKRSDRHPLENFLIDHNPLKNQEYAREYCRQVVSDELNGVVGELLDSLYKLQLKAKTGNKKGTSAKKRYVCGMREVYKLCKINRMRHVVVAPNIEPVDGEGGLDNLTRDIFSVCEDMKIPITFALTRKALAKPLRKKSRISMVGIVDPGGANEQYYEMINLSTMLQAQYEMIQHDELYQNPKFLRDYLTGKTANKKDHKENDATKHNSFKLNPDAVPFGKIKLNPKSRPFFPSGKSKNGTSVLSF
eukprot:CAMPEP_0167744510 /NCGR_PEP_ID=MMETSP0110_2-20121227/2633_1 /TAXON_ID=629695 /ORGANISM="Gymnochlora sp., Strain CCMP2014" /LENGTH=549 /DNA_ID=CAMNT_0007629043 /DNA_START=1207 /DNA_END=2856 /DNA_ORIENTATION=+